MKKLITLLTLVALTSVLAQNNNPNMDNNKPDVAVQEQTQNRDGLQELMKDLPESVKARMMEIKQAQNQIAGMKQQGKSDKEIEALMEQSRTQARERLREEVEAMKCSPEVKEKILQTVEQLQDRIQERKAEMKEINN